ncbi:Origin of replication complex subunit [Sesamum angolense]|uniref:Origin of replication complex subunit 4 n=1 Tax=Sesamum angolense TaxID=2727404 RepID=A0AAE1WUW7_9LAMI|nr:Origin of replication complex subunit [Sesamum angolense]
MGRLNPAEQAKIILRSRISSPSFVFSFFSQSPDSNYSGVFIPLIREYAENVGLNLVIVSFSVSTEVGNPVSILRYVLEIVLEELLKEHPDMISVIRLNGLLHCDNNCALKVELPILPPCCYTDCMNILEIARQLCLEHHLMFSKMASYDDNSQFLLSMLRECGLAHKTIVFVLDEFDLFTQGKQRLLYSLLDAMQSITSQAVVVGVSCRLDADQLLEKRVRSRFSHRKLLFLPPSREDLQRLVEHILLLPTDSSLPNDYTAAFNSKLLNILADEKFKGIIDTLCYSDSSAGHLLRFLFSAICHMDMNSGFLSVENFKSALPSIQRQPKLEALKDCSVLELYILVCMKRLEVKELELCNFNSIMKEYKSIHDTFQTSDYYARNVCLRAFEHLLDRALISFEDNKGHGQSAEFRPVKLLISWHELHQGLKSHRSCPLSHAVLTSKCASVAVA